jgi:hypothetical protein
LVKRSHDIESLEVRPGDCGKDDRSGDEQWGQASTTAAILKNKGEELVGFSMQLWSNDALTSA